MCSHAPIAASWDFLKSKGFFSPGGIFIRNVFKLFWRDEQSSWYVQQMDGIETNLGETNFKSFEALKRLKKKTRESNFWLCKSSLRRFEKWRLVKWRFNDVKYWQNLTIINSYAEWHLLLRPQAIWHKAIRRSVCGQSYYHFAIVRYNSRVVIYAIFLSPRHYSRILSLQNVYKIGTEVDVSK